MVLKNLDSLWANSVLAEKLEQQKKTGLILPRLLLTDIDGTFIDRDTERGKKEATNQLINYLNSKYYGIVAITGRDIAMMTRDYKKGILPMFDVVITSVGTERYILKDNKYVKDFSYNNFIKENLNFDRNKIAKYCEQFIEIINDNLSKKASLLKGIDLKLQPRDRINNRSVKTIKSPQPYKISFNFYGDEKVTEYLQKEFRAFMDRVGLSSVKLVFSVDSRPGKKIRNNIDVLPIEKDGAANILIKDLEIIFGRVFGVYAGDSMNDYHAIRLAGHAAIVVGGAEQNLLDKLQSLNLPHHIKKVQNNEPFRYVYIEKDEQQKGPTSLLSGIQTLETWLRENSTYELSPDLPELTPF